MSEQINIRKLALWEIVFLCMVVFSLSVAGIILWANAHPYKVASAPQWDLTVTVINANGRDDVYVLDTLDSYGDCIYQMYGQASRKGLACERQD